MTKFLAPFLLGSACLLPCAAQALTLHVEVSGQSDAVQVVDPDIPVLQFYTEAFGNSNLDIFAYVTTLNMNLSAGEGQGSSTFVATSGDQLYGQFSIRFTPSEQPSVFQIDGLTQFVGGTGLYNGATGSATFSGLGQFISDSQFNSSIIHDGSITLVPEPPVAMLMLLGLAGVGALKASRRS